MANSASANSLPPQAGVCLVQKYSVCSSSPGGVQSQSGVSMETNLLQVQGKEVTLLGPIATGGRGKACLSGKRPGASPW